ncbi:MAG: hypothetical protein EA371_06305 [Gammaproteobacteria bacterium]|nr:MAG: hypothetical protein EA371_06305 [Gammaproteobacteria bacterium]
MRTQASAALDEELNRGQGAGEQWFRRARDYRSWALMRSYPARVRRLAHTAIASSGPGAAPPDATDFHDICLALTGMLADLCQDAGRSVQSGQ